MGAMAAAATVVAEPLLAQPVPTDWRARLLDQDRILTLSRPQTKEKRTFCYWKKGYGYQKAGFMDGIWMLRDATYKKQNMIDPQLFDVLFQIQMWVRLEGRNSEMQVLSGYRTPEHNFRLEGAAKQSLHMQGKACDIHMPAVDTKLLAAMSMMIAAGGVGIYQDKGFIHVDTGRIRTWKG
ncbi:MULTISPECIES: YcbK family protein [Pseudomonas]|uniref:YcbK family protein n=1 Tax=Pseudomonas TaxID=286 RepID=UPI000F0373A4|nr:MULTISPECIES: DUF882 domain-containing protein [Pseudomonas]MBD8614844.1 DUF882 domain-containing protein [Pseudomonas putida]MBD8681472.1 DUF882 domain-containing protein [Pseudomonas sp. CFBP 13719]